MKYWFTSWAYIMNLLKNNIRKSSQNVARLNVNSFKKASQLDKPYDYINLFFVLNSLFYTVLFMTLLLSSTF